MRVLVLLFVVACATEPVAHSNQPEVTSGVVIHQFPVAVNRRLDVLFVIDDSSAMIEHQARLASNLRRFIDQLRALPGGLPNLRLAVTTSCTDGELRRDDDVIGNFLVDYVGPDGVRLRNYRGDLSDLVARIANVGTTGCTQTRPLASARRALERYENRSFMRENSYLAVIIINATDAPDPVSSLPEYEAFFKSVYDRPYAVVMGGVLGVDDATAVLPQFLDRFPNRSGRARLADDDWSAVVSALAPLHKTSLGSPCLAGPLLDVDPIAPGNQFECAVWYDFPVGGKVITPCTSSTGTCWKIVADRTMCDRDGGLFTVEQPPDMPEYAMLNVECLAR